jgi:Response regulators consisting of a CheY-like receiver domain and a winged-helix DNA-binding domain
MKKKILIVEESKAIRFLLQTIFGKKYEVISVGDGCTAIHWLSRKVLPDVIIAAPQLPDMKNWELIEYLKSGGLYSDIPLIALSSLDKSETQLICDEMGIENYFTKPFNPLDLQHTVERLIAIKDDSASLGLRRQLAQFEVG